MSVYEVTATSEANNRTFSLKNGENILGRVHPDLGLRHNLKLSRQQLRVIVDVSARRTTIERLGSNVSKRNGQDLPQNQIVELSNNDRITLVINECPVVFHIRDMPIPTRKPKTPQGAGTSDFDEGDNRIGLILEDDDAPGTSDEEGEGPSLGGSRKKTDRLYPEEFSDESPDILGSGSDSDLYPSDKDLHSTTTQIPAIKLEPPSSSPPRRRAAQSKRKTSRRVSADAPPTQVKASSSKRRVTAYGLFSKDVRTQLKKDYPKQPTAQITKLVKRRFEELADEEKQEYERRAREHNDSIIDQSSDDEEETSKPTSPPARRPLPIREEDGDEEEEETPLPRRRNPRRIASDMEVDDEILETARRDSDGTGSRTSVDDLPSNPNGRKKPSQEDMEMADVDGRHINGSTSKRRVVDQEEEDMWSRPAAVKLPSQPVSIMQESDAEEEGEAEMGGVEMGGMGGGLDPSLQWMASDDVPMAEADGSGGRVVASSPVKPVEPPKESPKAVEKVDKTAAPAATKKRKKFDVLRDIGFDLGSSSE
ncbi:hypothetical protein HK097_002239 [Rhizophlyctis rosea]|uniref:HMG box domain-containing protein n=1 Tax=Rhizophlyctis rosea TaxID=64517 RepID=A0AAD5S5M0_9FUNG|nr:hypothetical protein HK097_002239 [Rhizophlyctis rosea]